MKWRLFLPFTSFEFLYRSPIREKNPKIKRVVKALDSSEKPGPKRNCSNESKIFKGVGAGIGPGIGVVTYG